MRSHLFTCSRVALALWLGLAGCGEKKVEEVDDTSHDSMHVAQVDTAPIPVPPPPPEPARPRPAPTASAHPGGLLPAPVPFPQLNVVIVGGEANLKPHAPLQPLLSLGGLFKTLDTMGMEVPATRIERIYAFRSAYLKKEVIEVGEILIKYQVTLERFGEMGDPASSAVFMVKPEKAELVDVILENHNRYRISNKGRFFDTRPGKIRHPDI